MGKLGCVVVAVDGSEESMNALKWALKHLKLRTKEDDSEAPPGNFVILHVQAPPSISAGLNPGAIPFGGPSVIEVPAFSSAILKHQERITEAILKHALGICAEKKATVKTQVLVGDAREVICEVTESLKADLLVMGSHTYGPIKRMVETKKAKENDIIVANLLRGIGSVGSGPVHHHCFYSTCLNPKPEIIIDKDVFGKCEQLLHHPCTVPSHGS